MISIAELPSVNAALNSLSALLLVLGYCYIRSQKRRAHRNCMIAALASSTAFLVSYLFYHYHVGSVAFKGQGWIRPVYFAVLITHTLLAAVVVPLALVTFTRALREHFPAHRRIARWTFPVWLYVSVTGVVVYWMLYWLAPSL